MTTLERVAIKVIESKIRRSKKEIKDLQNLLVQAKSAVEASA